MLRIAIRCERRLFRDTLARCLGACADFHVVGHVATAEDLLDLCSLSRPDAVLFDAGAQVTDGLHAFELLRSRFPDTALVVAYDRLAEREVRTAMRSGVDVLVPCTHGLEGLLAVLRQCRDPGRHTRRGLTDLDREILMLIGAGHQADQIASLLGISKSAVENRKRRLYHKLEVCGQSQAVARAAVLGLLRRPSDTAGGLPDLTAREGDILRSIACGHTVRQTARLLGVAVKTVENTQARLFRKLGVRNRAAAFAAAQTLGLV